MENPTTQLAKPAIATKQCAKKIAATYDKTDRRPHHRRCHGLCRELLPATAFDSGKHACRACASQKKMRIGPGQGRNTRTLEARARVDAEVPKAIMELKAQPTSGHGDIDVRISRTAVRQITNKLNYGPVAEAEIEPDRCARHGRVMPCQLCALHGESQP